MSAQPCRYRAVFAYVDAILPDGEELPLFRLRHAGLRQPVGLCDLPGQHDDYQDSFLPVGSMGGTAEDALDTACGLYLSDATAGQPDPRRTIGDAH